MTEDDLVLFNEWLSDNTAEVEVILTTDSRVLLGELKDHKSQESLLRAILEVETYYRNVSCEKLKRCYQKDSVGKAILLFSGTRAFNEFGNEEHHWANMLLEQWGIEVFRVDAEKCCDCIVPEDNTFTLTRVK